MGKIKIQEQYILVINDLEISLTREELESLKISVDNILKERDNFIPYHPTYPYQTRKDITISNNTKSIGGF